MLLPLLLLLHCHMHEVSSQQYYQLHFVPSMCHHPELKWKLDHHLLHVLYKCGVGEGVCWQLFVYNAKEFHNFLIAVNIVHFGED